MQTRDLALVFVHRCGIDFAPLKFLFAFQLLQALDSFFVEAARLQRRPNRATRLALVPAIPEAAIRRKLLDVGERLGDAGFRLP